MQFLLIAVLFNALVGAAFGEEKDRSSAGFFYGLILGPIGWAIIALGPNYKPKCPFCKSIVVKYIRKCNHCESDLASIQLA